MGCLFLEFSMQSFRLLRIMNKNRKTESAKRPLLTEATRLTVSLEGSESLLQTSVPGAMGDAQGSLFSLSLSSCFCLGIQM